jgi:hypothetical protein
LIAAGIPVMVLVAGVTIWLLLGFSVGADQLDAIRTGGTVGVGLGGAVALWLAARKQRSTELDLMQKYEAHQLAERVAAQTEAATERAATHNEKVAEVSRAYQEQVAQDAREDAAARRITDLYSKAVDQVGSDKAPVRLGGLYALERLAQDTVDPTLRQTIVNVLCAYLRMPYIQPQAAVGVVSRMGDRRQNRFEKSSPPAARHLGRSGTVPEGDVLRQEFEVRLTAQRILGAHLKPGPDLDNPVEAFWPDMDLDLSGALLSDLDFAGISIRDGRFVNAKFAGYCGFDEAKFAGNVRFMDSEFTNVAEFRRAEFIGNVSFWRARFARAEFRNARFGGTAGFWNVQFGAVVGFGGVSFAGVAGFDEAVFIERASFRGATFAGAVGFTGAQFAVEPYFGGALARTDLDRVVERAWPAGWTASGDASLPGQGAPGSSWVGLVSDLAVPEQGAEEGKPGVPGRIET